MSLSPRSLARASSRRPWLTIAAWLVGMAVAAGVISALLGDALTHDATFTNNPEAKRAAKLVEARLRGPQRDTEFYIVSSPSATVDDPAFRAFVERVRADVDALGPAVVAQTETWYDRANAGLVSEDRHTTLVPAVLTVGRAHVSDVAPAVRGVLDREKASGFTLQVFGPASLAKDFDTVAEEDLKSGESVGVVAALVVLVVVFGAVVAATLPVAIGVAAITLAIAVTAVVGQLFHFSFFVTNMITMMGLAVGIDYSLFIVSRYREERHRGLDKLQAIEATGATASRAVFFSGLTVVLALLGMLLIPTTIFHSLAAGAIFVVLAAMLASLTLLPAVLSLLGDRVNALRIRRRAGGAGGGRPGGFWDRITHAVMRRPLVSLVACVLVLLAAAVSALDMRTGFSGVSTLPSSFEAKGAFDVLARDFSGGLSSPVEVVVDGRIGDPAVQAGIERLRRDLAADGRFGPSTLQVNAGGDLALVEAPVSGDPSGKAAVAAVGKIRRDYVRAAFPKGTPARALVGGETAFNKDFFDLTDRYMPIVFAFVLGLSFCLLTVAFRSLVVPLKALVLNLLSVGAAYGLVVLVSQKGVGAGILGFQKVEVIEAWLPLFLFSVLFGLSMDYHVFLLSRIREHYDLTGDNTGSVAFGLRTTAGIITGAALIMVAVFGGFASGRLVMFQQMGFGLAAAVLIDATLVRCVLVPATMKLLGDRNWYLPAWLGWLPRISVEAPEIERDHQPVEHAVAS